jgi:carbamoyl-phosphate synthase large subunit
VLGMGVNYQEALEKAIPSFGGNTAENYIFCSISDREKPASLPIIQELVKKVKLAATEGTAIFLQNCGIPVETVIKNEQDVNELFRNQSIKAVVNIPNQGRNKLKFGFYIREQAIRYKVPVFTHLDTVKAMIDLQTESSRSDFDVRTVSEFHKLEKRGAVHGGSYSVE